jgi:glycosyltransferase involved in cell wall biosynthesis
MSSQGETGPAPSGARRTASAVVCAYTLDRWEILCEGIEALVGQTLKPTEIVVVIDHNPELLERARARFTAATVVANAGANGISSSRNTAIALAHGDIVVFLDDDAVAEPDWLDELTRPYDDPAVIGTGGTPVPRWQASRPDWLPVEFYWTIGCAYRGLPTELAPVRNPIGASMSFRRDVLDRVGGFSDGFGPTMSVPNPHGGGEEAEFGIRARREFPDGTVIHVPTARVEHWVPAVRGTWRYYRRRCWLEGRTKALLADSMGADSALESERVYVRRILPTGVLGGLGETLRGDLAGLRRAGAIVAGLGCTAAGYAWGRLRSTS